MEQGFIEDVYHTLLGVQAEAARVPGVENLFAAGRVCERRYADMLEAYGRLCVRLGEEEEDEDVEIIIRSLMGIAREMGYSMFQYGAKFGRDGQL